MLVVASHCAVGERHSLFWDCFTVNLLPYRMLSTSLCVSHSSSMFGSHASSLSSQMVSFFKKILVLLGIG